MRILTRGMMWACTTAALFFAVDDLAIAAESSEQEKSFTVVLLPDTQNYSEKFPDTYVAQTLWIRERRKTDNIKFAIHLGDIVQTPSIESEWKNADRAMKILDGVVPYSMAPGNHDMNVSTRDSSLYNKYFPTGRFKEEKWYGGHMGQSNDNNFCFFNACGKKFMVLNLEFAPPDEVLKWAAKVTQQYSEHLVIVATHCYMRNEGRDTGCANGYELSLIHISEPTRPY